MNVLDFAKGTEKLVSPTNVGTVTYLQKKISRLPLCLQKRIVKAATKKADKMSFIVEPYAFFLFYEVLSPDKLQRHLPKSFVPAKSAIFEGDKKKFYGLVDLFRLHTSVFWGARAESYIITRNIETGLLSWTILDYMSDTISYDEKFGLKSPDAKEAIITTTCGSGFVADIKRTGTKISASCTASLKNAKTKKLNEELWIEGNTSISYSNELGGANGGLFSLTFLPEEMNEALEVPLKDIKEAKVEWTPEVFSEGKLERAVCFPFAQHMLSDSPGNQTYYGSKAALEKAASKIDFDKIKSLNR